MAIGAWRYVNALFAQVLNERGFFELTFSAQGLWRALPNLIIDLAE